MPHSGDLLIRRLHRRALIAAWTLSVALIAIAAAYARSATPSGARWSASLFVASCATFGLAIVASDLALLRMRAESRSQLALGLSTFANALVLLCVLLILLIPVWGVPIMLWFVLSAPLLLIPLAIPTIPRVLLVLTGLQVHRALGPGRGWRAGLALSPGVVIAGLYPVVSLLYTNWHPAAAAAADGVRAAWKIVGCAETYAADHGGRFPGSLAELGPGNAACLDAQLASGHVSGWSVRLTSGPRPSLIVRERTLPFATHRSFFSDASGVLHASGYTSHDATAADPALSSVTQELSRIHECLERSKASITHQLPASLWALSRWRSPCAVLPDAWWHVGGDSNVAKIRTKFEDRTRQSSIEEVYLYEYHPAFGPGGDVDSADVWARPERYGTTGIRSYLLTPSGAIHATPQDRPATRADPSMARCETYEERGCGVGDLIWTRIVQPRDTAGVREIAPIWQAHFAPPRSGSFWQPPGPFVARNHTIVAMSQAGVYAYGTDGSARWARPDIAVINGGAGQATDGTIYVADSASVLHAVDSHGHDVWRFPLGGPTHLPPLAWRGTIYVARQGSLLGVSSRGQLRWTLPLALPVDMAPARDDGVYVESGDGGLLQHVTADGRVDAYARLDSLRPCPEARDVASPFACSGTFRASLDPTTDHRFAMIPEEIVPRVRDRFVHTAQIRPDGSVVGNWDGTLRVVGPNLSTLWRAPGDGNLEIFRGAVVTGADVAAVTHDWMWGYGVSGFDAGGRERWRARLQADYFSPPAVGRDGVVYVVGINWTLYAVRPPEGLGSVR